MSIVNRYPFSLPAASAPVPPLQNLILCCLGDLKKGSLNTLAPALDILGNVPLLNSSIIALTVSLSLLFFGKNLNAQNLNVKGCKMKRYFDDDAFEVFLKDFDFLFKIIKDERGELDIKIRPNNSFNLYYKGQSLAKIVLRKNQPYEIVINTKFLNYGKHDYVFVPERRGERFYSLSKNTKAKKKRNANIAQKRKILKEKEEAVRKKKEQVNKDQDNN